MWVFVVVGFASIFFFGGFLYICKFMVVAVGGLLWWWWEWVSLWVYGGGYEFLLWILCGLANREEERGMKRETWSWKRDREGRERKRVNIYINE